MYIAPEQYNCLKVLYRAQSLKQNIKQITCVDNNTTQFHVLDGWFPCNVTKQPGIDVVFAISFDFALLADVCSSLVNGNSPFTFACGKGKRGVSLTYREPGGQGVSLHNNSGDKLEIILSIVDFLVSLTRKYKTYLNDGSSRVTG